VEVHEATGRDTQLAVAMLSDSRKSSASFSVAVSSSSYRTLPGEKNSTCLYIAMYSILLELLMGYVLRQAE
jgi:hypothetical protein